MATEMGSYSTSIGLTFPYRATACQWDLRLADRKLNKNHLLWHPDYPVIMSVCKNRTFIAWNPRVERHSRMAGTADTLVSTNRQNTDLKRCYKEIRNFHHFKLTLCFHQATTKLLERSQIVYESSQIQAHHTPMMNDEFGLGTSESPPSYSGDLDLRYGSSGLDVDEIGPFASGSALLT